MLQLPTRHISTLLASGLTRMLAYTFNFFQKSKKYAFNINNKKFCAGAQNTLSFELLQKTLENRKVLICRDRWQLLKVTK